MASEYVSNKRVARSQAAPDPNCRNDGPTQKILTELNLRPARSSLFVRNDGIFRRADERESLL